MIIPNWLNDYKEFSERDLESCMGKTLSEATLTEKDHAEKLKYFCRKQYLKTRKYQRLLELRAKLDQAQRNDRILDNAK